MSNPLACDFVIIDDDPINNLLCTMYIQKVYPKAEIHAFTDPEYGLRNIESTYPNKLDKKTVLLLDINMPVLSGWDVLDKLSNLPEIAMKQICIYILSSSISPNDKQKAGMNPLITDFIEKPLSIERLDAIISGRTS